MNYNSDFGLKKASQFPLLTVDCIIRYNDKIVLIKRKYPPRGWALPGGFVEKGESLEKAVKREVKEETSLDLNELRQFQSYSEPQRDPRFHTVSVVFIAIGLGTIKASSDAKEIKLFSIDNIPGMVFDHNKILEDYVNDKF